MLLGAVLMYLTTGAYVAILGLRNALENAEPGELQLGEVVIGLILHTLFWPISVFSLLEP